MGRLALIVLAASVLGIAAGWLFADQFHLAWDARIVLSLIFAVILAAFGYVVARR